MKDRLFFGNTFCAVEHSFDSVGNEQFHCLQLVKEKNELVIANSGSFDSIEKLFSFLDEIKQEHLVVVLNNNQVLFKSIAVVEPNSDLVFKNAYPTLAKNDFYAQVAYSDSNSFISIVRNTYVKQIIKEYSENDLVVLDVVLGNLPATSVADILDYEEVFTSNSKLTISNKKIVAFEYKSFDKFRYEVNGLKVESSYVLSLASIVDFYLKKKVYFTEELLTDFKDRKVFNLGYKVVLSLLFLMVLINFLVFNNYNQSVNNLQQELKIKKGAKRKLKDISMSLEKKRKLLSELQNSSLFSVSKYTDQIVEELPNSVILSEINYQPVKGTIRKGKETEFLIKEIEVKGVLNDYHEFTSWIDSVERKDWVNQLLELATEKNKRRKSSNFHIVIRIK